MTKQLRPYKDYSTDKIVQMYNDEVSLNSIMFYNIFLTSIIVALMFKFLILSFWIFMSLILFVVFVLIFDRDIESDYNKKKLLKKELDIRKQGEKDD